MKIEIWLVEARKHVQYFQPWPYFDRNLECNHQRNYTTQYRVAKFLNMADEVFLNRCNPRHSKSIFDHTIPMNIE